MAALLAAGHQTDVEIVTADGQSLRAHKAILSARSPVFSALFGEAQWQDAAAGHIDMPRFGTTTVQALLVWLYTGKLPDKQSPLPAPRHGLDAALDASPATAKRDSKDPELEHKRTVRARKGTAVAPPALASAFDLDRYAPPIKQHCSALPDAVMSLSLLYLLCEQQIGCGQRQRQRQRRVRPQRKFE